MADNYTQFSEAWSLKAEAKEWLTQRLETVLYSAERKEIVNPGSDEGWDAELPRFCVEAVLDGRATYDEVDTGGLDISVDDSGEEPVFAAMAECHGNGFIPALLMQDYFRKFEPEGCATLTWACTCDKPRLGEFGGGALFITAEKIEWMASHEWAMDKAAVHEAMHAPSPSLLPCRPVEMLMVHERHFWSTYQFMVPKVIVSAGFDAIVAYAHRWLSSDETVLLWAVYHIPEEKAAT